MMLRHLRISRRTAAHLCPEYPYTKVVMSSATKLLPPRRKKWKLIILLLAFLTVAVVVALALGLTLTRKRLLSIAATHADDAPNEPSESEYPDPQPMNGTVPNNKNWRTMDPGLIRRASDGKLFLFTTGAWGEPNGTVWTADSLYGPWEKSPTPMINQQAGAPQVYNLNGTYYMFHNHHFDYSTLGVSDLQADKWYHDSSVFVRSSDTMEHGTWTFHGRIDITWQSKYNILDPSLLTVDNTTAGTRRNFLAFGSYQTGLYQVPLTDPPLSLAKDAMDQLTHLEENATRISHGINDRTEASFTYVRGGWYYLFFSSGICCHLENSWALAIQDPYRVMVCRSSEPRTGYVDQDGKDCATENGGTEILGTHGRIFAPGGQGVMDDDEAQGPILYYHYGKPVPSVVDLVSEGANFLQ